MTANGESAALTIASELAMHYRNDGRTGAPIGCSCGQEFDGFTTWRRHIADAVLDVLGLEAMRFGDCLSDPRYYEVQVTLHPEGECRDLAECEPVYRLIRPEVGHSGPSDERRHDGCPYLAVNVARGEGDQAEVWFCTKCGWSPATGSTSKEADDGDA